MNYSLESFAFGKGQHYIKNARQQSTNTLNTPIVFDQWIRERQGKIPSLGYINFSLYISMYRIMIIYLFACIQQRHQQRKVTRVDIKFIH